MIGTPWYDEPAAVYRCAPMISEVTGLAAKICAGLAVCVFLSSIAVAEIFHAQIPLEGGWFDLETGAFYCNSRRCPPWPDEVDFDFNQFFETDGSISEFPAIFLYPIPFRVRSMAIYDEQPFETIGFADIAAGDFQTGMQFFGLEPDDTVILQTDTGLYYRIGNIVRDPDTNLVDFDYESLGSLPQLTLEKTSDVPEYSEVGELINYTYRVNSTGTRPVTGPVTVVDDKLDVDCPAVSTVGNFDDDLDPGEELICNAAYSIVQADIDARSITNLATARGDGGNVESEQQSVTVLWVALPMILVLDKTADRQLYINPGEVINYSYIVRSTGIEPVAGPITIDDDRETVTCPDVNTVGNGDANLDPNEAITCTVSHTIVQADLDAGSITNTATASGEGGNLDSNSDQWTADYLFAAPILVLEKSADVLTYSLVGDVINYSYEVSNTGNRGAQGLIVVDNKVTVTCPELSTIGDHDNILDPGETIICNASYTVVQADIDAGSITNAAAAFTGGVISNEAELTVTWVRSNIVFKSSFE